MAAFPRLVAPLALAHILSIIALPASAQEKSGFQLRSINSEMLGQVSSANTFIDRIGPANAAKRLAIEGVLDRKSVV